VVIPEGEPMWKCPHGFGVEPFEEINDAE
jgi:hypothetical protein